MTPAQARALFLDQLGPNDTLAHYGEAAAVKAILTVVEPLEEALRMIAAGHGCPTALADYALSRAALSPQVPA